MKILITGSKGFIGKNITNFIQDNYTYEVLEFNRGQSLESLAIMIKEADFIIHLAGVNRPKVRELFKEVNIELTEYIASTLKDNLLKTPILFSSSTQANLNNDYGISKLKAEKILSKLNQSNKNPIIICRLPGVFGKWSKPNYNSVVSTFCFNTINNIDLEINDPNKEISLVYIDDVSKDFCELLNKDLKGLTSFKN